ncbi:hypothetical protein TMatcc_004978 [Talaromyces marneffei ATCC 18224]
MSCRVVRVEILVQLPIQGLRARSAPRKHRVTTLNLQISFHWLGDYLAPFGTNAVFRLTNAPRQMYGLRWSIRYG